MKKLLLIGALVSSIASASIEDVYNYHLAGAIKNTQVDTELCEYTRYTNLIQLIIENKDWALYLADALMERRELRNIYDDQVTVMDTYVAGYLDDRFLLCEGNVLGMDAYAYNVIQIRTLADAAWRTADLLMEAQKP
jgi:hypothetical protein